MLTKSVKAKEALYTLRDEYKRVCTDITTLETQNEKIVGFALTIIGAGAIYGVKEGLDEVFFALPFALLNVGVFTLWHYYRIFRLGGYKLSIEEKINNILGDNVLVWETVVDKNTNSNIASAPVVALIATAALLAPLITSYSIYQIFSKEGFVSGVILCAGIVANLVVLTFSAQGARQAFASAYKAAKTTRNRR